MSILKQKKLIILAIIIIVAIGLAVFFMFNNGERCVDIIGDGYAMGTDPYPVVIGNTCDAY